MNESFWEPPLRENSSLSFPFPPFPLSSSLSFSSSFSSPSSPLSSCCLECRGCRLGPRACPKDVRAVRWEGIKSSIIDETQRRKLPSFLAQCHGDWMATSILWRSRDKLKDQGNCWAWQSWRKETAKSPVPLFTLQPFTPRLLVLWDEMFFPLFKPLFLGYFYHIKAP